MSPFPFQSAEVVLGVAVLVLLVLCFLLLLGKRKEDPKMVLLLNLLADLPADDREHAATHEEEKDGPEPAVKGASPVSHLRDFFA